MIYLQYHSLEHGTKHGKDLCVYVVLHPYHVRTQKIQSVLTSMDEAQSE